MKTKRKAKWNLEHAHMKRASKRTPPLKAAGFVDGDKRKGVVERIPVKKGVEGK